ncbi:MAG: hypothetical protein J6S85_19880 [Methanobrevibacter sp.]|nr:hypothetical protein [Methanobrevibacter sp.]
MMNMQKTTFGSRFMVFEKDSFWHDAIFCNRRSKQITSVDPAKRKYDEYSGKYDNFSECDEIVILQIQQEGNNFMIEYVYK